MTKKSQEIRREFIQFFTDRQHDFVPSSPLLPADDPTLLFANAGMNQFKDVFLGTGTRPYGRAVNSQKCIRAGGKHNDLEDVGHDTYHHTFFEMLGNWSFGDYFKAEAIEWAWELLTGVWGLPKERLYATVFESDPSETLQSDTEARELWPKVTGIPEERILGGGLKDNFWMMGETGPCGPCTEIHVDLGAQACGGLRHPGVECGVNVGNCGRFVELWNLVFIQFNLLEGGKLEPLPARHVDTGMGLERVSAVLQARTDNYATDVFAPLMARLAERSGVRYGDAPETDVALRVIADHARSCSFAIADGVLPSNEGRGYVVRRILRRAARFGRKLGQHEPFLHLLVPVLAEQMGDFFPEMQRRADVVAETLREEEASFNRTLDRGLELFERAAAKADRVIGGDVAFELQATYGFPIDLTELMAAERGLDVDTVAYEQEMARHREISAAGGGFQAAAITDLPETDDSAKYDPKPAEATVLGWVVENHYVCDGALAAGAEAAVVLDRTNFYGEQGGQVGDGGWLRWPGGRFEVRDAKLVGHCVLHVGTVAEGMLRAGQAVTAEVSEARMDTRRNHTATHLLNWALREVCGEGIDQAGSVVGPDRLRFDFTHGRAVEAEQLAEVERRVNDRILSDEPVRPETMPLAEAREIPGVRAVFGEKYPDPVRVVRIGGGTSAEFCGGTHLDRTGQAGLFKILSEESVARGVRRITAVTGHEAVRHVQALDQAARSASAALRVPVAEIGQRAEAMVEEVKRLRKRSSGGAAASTRSESIQTPDGAVAIVTTETADAAAMRSLCDVQRQRGLAAMLVGGVAGRKVTLVAMVSQALADAGKLKADEWVRAAAAVVGGGGGGKATMAQAGGKVPEKLPEALAAGAAWVRSRLGEAG